MFNDAVYGADCPVCPGTCSCQFDGALELKSAPEACCPSYRRRDLADGVCPHCGRDHSGEAYAAG